MYDIVTSVLRGGFQVRNRVACTPGACLRFPGDVLCVLGATCNQVASNPGACRA